MGEARWDPRRPQGGQFSITWRGPNSKTCSTEGCGLDISDSGIGIACAAELKTGSIVYVQAKDGSFGAECEVVHCTRRGTQFHVGLEMKEEAEQAHRPTGPAAAASPSSGNEEQDYYETLQISRKADMQTIHRVFKIMALRFHPDNPETGNLEQFLRMKRAYAVLSDPALRAQYDDVLEKNRSDEPRRIFKRRDFVNGVEAEANRRLGVCCLLYRKRQINPDHPGISLLDLEREMGFPREYLSFTMWYLRAKSFVTVADNSDYALTAEGADYVEQNAAKHEIVSKILNPASQFENPGGSDKGARTTPTPASRPLLTA